MKPFRMFVRSIRDAFKSVFRNFSLSLASISCITITLLVVTVALIVSLNVEHFTKNIKDDVTIVVYLNEDYDSKNAKATKTKIEQLNNIATIEFKSKEDIKNEMGSSSEALKQIMDTWEKDANPLKDTFLVTVKDIKEISTTADKIQKMEEISYVDYGETMVNKLIKTFDLLEKVMIVTVVSLIIVTVFLIINTIKLTIFSRKREISIMRLVGASNITIKMPFIVEGMVLGLLGSIIPVIITIYGYIFVYNNFDGQILSPLIQLIKPEPFVYMISGIIILLGIIVGMLGSYRASRKYLKI